MKIWKVLFGSYFVLAISLAYSTETFVKEISYYEGFGGAGPKMRKETIYKVGVDKKVEVAQKILVDQTNELREIWSTDLGASGANNNLTNKQIAEKYFQLADNSKEKNEDNIHKGTCEEITETYIICNGSRYVLDPKNDDRLKRDMKQIEKNILPGVSDSSSGTEK